MRVATTAPLLVALVQMACAGGSAEHPAREGGADSSAGGAGGANSIVCYVDFPCDYSSWCDPDTHQRMIGVSRDCSAVCGDAPCSGGDCAPSPGDCGPGKVCVDVGTWVSFDAECLPVASACGGPEQRACAPGEVCEYGPYVPNNNGWGGTGPPSKTEASGGYGRCVPAPDASTDAAASD